MNDENRSKVVTVGASVILNKFLALSGAKISFGTICDTIDACQKNAVFSMLEMNNVLKHWGFETLAVKAKPEALFQIEYPVISHMVDHDNEEFIILQGLSSEMITYIQAGSNAKEEMLDNFLPKWKGIVLMAQSDTEIIEDAYVEKKLRDDEIVRGYKKNKMKIIDNFFSKADCIRLIESSKNLFQRSLVKAGGEDNIESNYRTSQSAFLRDLDESTKVQITEKCIHLLEHLPFNEFEDIQCVSYDVGQEFKAHFDSGKGIKRLYTILIYLNDNFQGGETYFPLLDLTIKPKLGQAIMFHNLNSDDSIDIYSFHAGLPVSKGNKFACNVWVR
jgi:hypothetical protein